MKTDVLFWLVIGGVFAVILFCVSIVVLNAVYPA